MSAAASAATSATSGEQPGRQSGKQSGKQRGAATSGDAGPQEGASRLVVWLAFATFAALPVVTVVGHVNEFADGSFLTVVAASDHPWATFWQNYPARATAYVVSGFLPHLALEATGSARAAILTYQVGWASAPLLSLLACARILPRERRRMLLYPAAWFCGVGLTIYGFPSEVWLLQALAWPLLFAVTCWSGTVRQVAVVWVAAFAFAFSHEMMVFTAPVLVVAALLAARRRGHRADWALWPLLVAPAAAIAVAHLAEPTDPVVADAVTKVSSEVLQLPNLVTGTVAVLIIVVVLAGTVELATRLFLSERPKVVLALRCGAVVLAAALATTAGVLARDRYLSRTAVAVALPVILALSLLEALRAQHPGDDESQVAADRRIGTARQFVTWCALPLFVVQVCLGARFVQAFDGYRSELGRTVTHEAPGSEETDGVVPSDTHRFPKAAFSRGTAWVLPYQSLLAADGHPHWLLRSTHDTYVPLDCSRARDFSHLPDQGAALLADYVCTMRP